MTSLRRQELKDSRMRNSTSMRSLSKEANVIGVYINLNKDLIPALQIRYARPVTAEKIWEKLNAPKWNITYANGTEEEMDPAIGFETPGVELEY